jgi:hypothetical protein
MRTMNRIFYIFLLCGVLFSLAGQAAVIQGKTLEQATSEPLVGATVHLENTTFHAVSGLDGSYSLRNVPAGTYTLRVHFLSYRPIVRQVIISGGETVTVDALLEPDTRQTLQEVTVRAGRDGGSEQASRHLERHADQVLNSVSGKAIQLSPDLTVANVIQRVSGISVERNSNGDGQYAIVRGMDKRYNYTLVNGVKIPSPDNKYRYVPLDIFPSELLERLEVYKTLTPSMEGDAIGGAVNLVMKEAAERPMFSAQVSTGYSELFMERPFMSYSWNSVAAKSPYERNGNQYNATSGDFSKTTATYKRQSPPPNLLGGFSWGNRFWNRKLGVVVAGSYQNTYRGSNSLFFDSETVDTLRGVTLTKLNQRQYSEQQRRMGLHTNIDFRLNPRHKFQWYNAWINLVNSQIRDVQTTQLTIGGYDPALGNATLEYSTRSRVTRQQIFNSTLQGRHQLSDPFSVHWAAVYSIATNKAPDQTLIPLAGERRHFVDTPTTIQDGYRRWEHNTDTDLAGYLHLTYLSTLGGMPVEWKAGGLYRDKQRNNFYNNYQLRPANLQARYGVDFTSYDQIDWTVQNPRGSVATALNFDASEKTSAGYLQGKLLPERWEIIGGVRLEHNVQGYKMKFPIGEDRPDGGQTTTDVLPSLNLKYKANARTNLRASYFRSVNRPGFFEIVPYRIVQEEYQERGNPDLRRAIADNVDVRYEFFPSLTNQFMAGAFYKNIQDPIEYTLQRDAVRGQDTYYSPGNFGNARNLGIELDFIQYFRRFGIKANYTFTDSRITTAKSKRIRNTAGDLETITVSQTRPLYGQSAHIANLTVLYKHNGWDGQVAASYTGDRINTVSQFVDNDLWQKGFVQMDAAVEKTFGNGLVLFAKASNLLNTPMEVYIKNASSKNEGIPYQDLSGKTVMRKDFYQRTYLLGIRYKLQ